MDINEREGVRDDSGGSKVIFWHYSWAVFRGNKSVFLDSWVVWLNTRTVLNKQIFGDLHSVIAFFVPSWEKCFSACNHWWVKVVWLLIPIHPPSGLLQGGCYAGPWGPWYRLFLSVWNWRLPAYICVCLMRAPSSCMILMDTLQSTSCSQWLLNVVPLVSEVVLVFFTGHSLILSDSRLALRLSIFPAMHPNPG